MSILLKIVFFLFFFFFIQCFEMIHFEAVLWWRYPFLVILIVLIPLLIDAGTNKKIKIKINCIVHNTRKQGASKKNSIEKVLAIISAKKFVSTQSFIRRCTKLYILSNNFFRLNIKNLELTNETTILYYNQRTAFRVKKCRIKTDNRNLACYAVGNDMNFKNVTQ